VGVSEEIVKGWRKERIKSTRKMACPSRPEGGTEISRVGRRAWAIFGPESRTPAQEQQKAFKRKRAGTPIKETAARSISTEGAGNISSPKAWEERGR